MISERSTCELPDSCGDGHFCERCLAAIAALQEEHLQPLAATLLEWNEMEAWKREWWRREAQE